MRHTSFAQVFRTFRDVDSSGEPSFAVIHPNTKGAYVACVVGRECCSNACSQVCLVLRLGVRLIGVIFSIAVFHFVL